jgi:hypothetical protein
MIVKRKYYNYMLNASIVGLIISFIYFGFVVERYGQAKFIFDVLWYGSLAIFITTIALKFFRLVK